MQVPKVPVCRQGKKVWAPTVHAYFRQWERMRPQEAVDIAGAKVNKIYDIEFENGWKLGLIRSGAFVFFLSPSPFKDIVACL